jgi:hypothetical protein
MALAPTPNSATKFRNIVPQWQRAKKFRRENPQRRFVVTTSQSKAP